MFNLIGKDFLTLSKNRSELIELLLTPFLLIAILGFALGNVTGQTATTPEQTTVGLVDQSTIAKDEATVIKELMDAGHTQVDAEKIVAEFEQMDPVRQMKGLFQEADIEQHFALQTFESKEDAEQALEANDISGVIVVSEIFKSDIIRANVLQNATNAEIEVITQDPNQIKAIILTNIMEGFIQEYNFQATIAPIVGETVIEDQRHYGEVVPLTTQDPINSFEYYTLSMAVFFALGISTIIASRSFKEKESHVLARIMLSKRSPMQYLFSKLVSGILITMIQLGILFTLSTLIFGTFSERPLSFWVGIVLVSCLFSILIGSMGSLLTAISLNTNDVMVVSSFGSSTVVLAFLGGSFVPLEQYANFLKTLGDWTPNGAALTSYLQFLMGFDIVDVLPLLLRMLGLSVIFMIIAVIVFPKWRLD
ncbi:ABC transporter permease [Marinilactibacillus kalidii]|uniref:ABC transporter permease n=1 Tax=Marinilactibacillus kalidii TaxID=2820274 RepID=UPI001ABDBA5C|nr:ABC transporter permease [Marinilactibacillus kalidii]